MFHRPKPFASDRLNCSAEALIKYSALLSVSLFGFAVAIYIGFGTEEGIYNSIWSTFVAVATAPAGGVDLGPVIDKNNSLARPCKAKAHRRPRWRPSSSSPTSSSCLNT